MLRNSGRSAGSKEQSWRVRLISFAVVLCFVLGLAGSPLCLRAQPVAHASASAMPMDGAHSAEHCGDPCCTRHKVPHRAPQESHWCAYQCVASVPTTEREFSQNNADAGYPPAHVSVGMGFVAVHGNAESSSVPDPDPPLPFALPLRI